MNGNITIELWQLAVSLLVAMGVPSAITGFCFWNMERRITKRDKAKDAAEAAARKEVEEKEQAREELNILLVKSTGAAIALGEATATAIKNGHSNGETEAALSYAQKVKHEQKDFLTKQGIKAVLD